jgi:hypothetical protein
LYIIYFICTILFLPVRILFPIKQDFFRCGLIFFYFSVFVYFLARCGCDNFCSCLMQGPVKVSPIFSSCRDFQYFQLIISLSCPAIQKKRLKFIISFDVTLLRWLIFAYPLHSVVKPGWLPALNHNIKNKIKLSQKISCIRKPKNFFTGLIFLF